MFNDTELHMQSHSGLSQMFISVVLFYCYENHMKLIISITVPILN